MKFCCQEFKQDWELTHHGRPNIRIIKIDPAEIPEVNPKYLYRFFFTVGYQEGEINVPRRLFKFCPYCGISLFKYYKLDSYVNEKNHGFISFV